MLQWSLGSDVADVRLFVGSSATCHLSSVGDAILQHDWNPVLHWQDYQNLLQSRVQKDVQQD